MTALDADRFVQALEIVGHERLCRHEAGHAAAALLGGLDVRSARAGRYTLAELEHADPDGNAGEVIVVDPERDTASTRAFAVATLCGPLNEDRAYWPPKWPLSSVPQGPDEAAVGRLVKSLDLDELGYNALTLEAFELCASREFERLSAVTGHMLEQHGTLDGETLHRIKSITEGAIVDHLTLKAVTTVSTDEGTFEAVISTESVDRERDIVDANAMVKALRAWIGVGKLVPLAWQHSPKAEDQIGHIKPDTVKAVNGEVVASGWIDQSTERGRHAWRLVKSGTLGFSFGYLTLAATKREGGGNHITELDVFEVSATPTPMNHGTRVLGWKSIDGDSEYDRIRGETRELMFTVMGAPAGDAGDPLREKSQRVARECGPVQIASFEC